MSRTWLVLLLTPVLTACGGASSPPAPDVASGEHTFLQSGYPEQLQLGHGTLSGALVARGDSLFHGVIGRANCTICHGPLGMGGAGGSGTVLRDTVWHNGDGGYAFILTTIQGGVKPRGDHLVAMPPQGGMPLTPGEMRALAAYVYWISHQPPHATPASHGGH